MATGTICETESGFIVSDEHGNEWDVESYDGHQAMFVREDSQRFYGATWFGGTVSDAHDETRFHDGNQEWKFDPMRGWVEV